MSLVRAWFGVRHEATGINLKIDSCRGFALVGAEDLLPSIVAACAASTIPAPGSPIWWAARNETDHEYDQRTFTRDMHLIGFLLEWRKPSTFFGQRPRRRRPARGRKVRKESLRV